jgi:hypothetical protein
MHCRSNPKHGVSEKIFSRVAECTRLILILEWEHITCKPGCPCELEILYSGRVVYEVYT